MKIGVINLNVAKPEAKKIGVYALVSQPLRVSALPGKQRRVLIIIGGLVRSSSRAR